MSRSCSALSPIPPAARLADSNRRQAEKRRVSYSILCSASSGNKAPPSDSVTYATTSAGNLYSCVAPVPSFSLSQPRLELGLSAVSFALAAVFGSFLSLGVISIAAMGAFKRLGISASRLEKVVAREVPGTLLSLRLSGMEISGVTQHLSSIRRVVSGADRRQP
uniref:Uncharacterized protein n=1 Tax=Kalanchoe fedtschenkoi TaxID=63787 RepID=A0A7N0UBP6_KALFE